MKIIGVTGGIGAGKSTVLSILKQDYQGYVLEADRVAHSLMEPGQAAYRQIVSAFSASILDGQGKIQREKMAELVFRSPERLEQLNQIVHPEVKYFIQTAIQECRQAGTVSLFVIEAALLIEDGYQEICDELWYIYAPEAVRISRLMQERQYTREKCLAVMGNQASDEFYRSHCTRMIENYHSLENTKKQIEDLLKNL